MKQITIRTNLTRADFVKVNFVLFFQRRSAKILLVIALLMIALPVLIAFKTATPVKWLQVLIGVGMIAFYLLSTYLSARKNYSAIPGIRDHITYEFTDDQITCTTSTSSSQSKWEAIYRLSTTRDCLLIWRSPQTVNVLPKRDITSEQLAAIKQIATRNKVKNNLK